MYGLPSIATSLADYDPQSFDGAVEATMRIVAMASAHLHTPLPSLMRPNGMDSKPGPGGWQHPASHFLHANLMLNLNIPARWNGRFMSGPHGARWYKAPTRINQAPSGMTVEVGAATVVNEGQVGTDTHTVDSLGCSITVMPTWPQLHPLAVPDEILSIANQPDADGFPEWLSSQ